MLQHNFACDVLFSKAFALCANIKASSSA